MSRSQPTITNPCSKFIEISSEDGTFYYYDKDAEKKVEVEMPVYFSVLDELNTITGFNKRHKCGIFSNEVHSTTKEILRVKTFKGGESVTGYYQDIRDSIIAMGGKFAKSVYALLIKEDMSTEFVNFKFKGAAFSAWIDFRKKVNPMNFIIGVNEFIEEQNGNNKYQVPVFKPFKSSPEIDAAAIEQDKILQDYLKIYKAQQPEKEVEQAAAEEAKNPLTDEFPANDKWMGKSKSEEAPMLTKERLIAKAKAAMEVPSKGKQTVKSMTDPKELERLTRKEDQFPEHINDPEDDEIPTEEMSDLPF